MPYVLALDQGTTSSRAIVFDRDGAVRALGAAGVPADLPAAGLGRARRRGDLGDAARPSRARRWPRPASAPRDIAAIGITNQRETTVLWDRAHRPAARTTPSSGRTGAPRPSATSCSAAGARGADPRARPGWCSTPTSPAPSSRWLLDHVPGARARAERGELAFGTVDTWLVWKLTGGRVHVTDASQRLAHAALRHPHAATGTTSCCALLDIPRAMLPRGRAPRSERLRRDRDRPVRRARCPIAGIAGDQQAALFGQACFAPGMAKNTYGTGCFLLMNTGDAAGARRGNSLLTTVAWQRRRADATTRSRAASSSPAPSCSGCATGSGIIRSAGRDRGAGRAACRTTAASTSCRPSPASARRTGTRTRAARSVGLTRGTTAAHLARAALEAIAFQSADVLEAMADGRRHHADASCASTAAPPPTTC